MNSQYEEFEDSIKEIIKPEQIKKDEPMKKHTSFQIGGPADYFISPSNTDELIKLIDIINNLNLPYYILGGGNNLLVSDKGYRGIIICLNHLNNISVNKNEIIAGCGAKLRDIAKVAMNSSLTGYEFASGIPGTIGGATFMNAGAYGGEHKDIIKAVTYLENGMLKTVLGKDCNFGYRQSIFKEGNRIITEVILELIPGNKEEIKEKITDLTNRRISKQPLNFPSAGSTFKRPEGYFAGKLIEDNGFKGKQIGGAAVSDKHAGFVINKDQATAQDVLDLIRLIQKTVKENNKVDLETEVIFIGETQ